MLNTHFSQTMTASIAQRHTQTHGVYAVLGLLSHLETTRIVRRLFLGYMETEHHVGGTRAPGWGCLGISEVLEPVPRTLNDS